jgi:hypothetical protein
MDDNFFHLDYLASEMHKVAHSSGVKSVLVDIYGLLSPMRQGGV